MTYVCAAMCAPTRWGDWDRSAQQRAERDAVFSACSLRVLAFSRARTAVACDVTVITFGPALAVKVCHLCLDPLPALYTVYIRPTFRLKCVL